MSILPRSVLIALACFLLLATLGVAVSPAAAAELSERSLTEPSDWWWLTGASAGQVKARIDLGYRLIDLEVDSTSPLRFSAVFVRNQGSHRKGWWWYYGKSSSEVQSLLRAKQARILDLEVYRDGPNKRYALVMVRNTGSDRKAWWYYSDMTAAALKQKIAANGARLVDLDSYSLAGQRRFSAVMIANSGADRKAWWWYTDLGAVEIPQKLRRHRARIVDLEPRSDGRYSVVLEQLQGESWWWYRGETLAQIKERAAQNGARLIDVERYRDGGRTVFASVMIDNSAPATGRFRRYLSRRTDGAFGFHLEGAGGTTRASLQSSRQFYPASTIKVLEHFHALRQVEAGRASLDGSRIRKYPARRDSCADRHAGQSSVSETLRQALRRMMLNSDNQSTNALQEFFGGNDAARGRQAINGTARGSAGLSQKTAIRHKFDCGGPSNNPANSMVLEDATRLYARLARGELLNANNRASFFANMLNQGNDRFIDSVIDQEAPPGVDTAAFKRGVRMAHKAGGWEGNTSIAGWVLLPTKTGGRDFAYGLFVEGASRFDVSIRAAAAELLREEIRSALATYL